MSGDATINRILAHRQLASQQAPTARSTPSTSQQAPPVLAPRSSPPPPKDRFVTAIVTERWANTGTPMGLAIPGGRQLCRLPVLDERGRVVGEVAPDPDVATWVGEGPLSECWTAKQASKAEAAQIARNGQVVARVDANGVVVGLRIKR